MPDTINQQIGARIRARLEYLERDQSGLGAVLGKSQGTVSRILSGSIPITAADLVRTAEYLRMSPSLLVGQDAPETPDDTEAIRIFRALHGERRIIALRMLRLLADP